MFPITSATDCAAAARALRLQAFTVSDDHRHGTTYYPKGCYYQYNSHLKYNAENTNRGSCSLTKQCLCKKHAAPFIAAPLPTPAPFIAVECLCIPCGTNKALSYGSGTCFPASGSCNIANGPASGCYNEAATTSASTSASICDCATGKYGYDIDN